MNLQEQILRINELLMNDKAASSYVVFVSGVERDMNHAGQTKLFVENFTKKYPIKSFNFKNSSAISSFVEKNNIIAVVLFSAACKLANQLNIPSRKIYCIEPWNGKKTDAGTSFIFSSIPSSNMYIDYQSYSRGKGTKNGANSTNHSQGHFNALINSARDISNKI